jgi:hypothetical protein
VLPVKRDKVGPVSTLQCFFKALFVVNIRGNHFNTRLDEFLRLAGTDIPRDRPRGKATTRIIHNCADKAATLRPGGTHYCNDFPVTHDDPPC